MITSAVATVIDSGCTTFLVGFPLSATWIKKFALSATVGVPLMTPDELNDEIAL